MLDYLIAGLNPYAFHLSNNIWAGFVTGFVYLTALVLTRNRIIAILSAVLFVVHPVHVEAIAWISSRKDLVAAAFALPSFIAYLQYRETKSKNGRLRWYILSLLLFFFATAGKLSVATFPAVFLAYDLFIEKRPFLRCIVDKIPFLVIGLVFGIIVSSAQPPTGHHPDSYTLALSFLQSLWLLTGFGNYVLYHVPPGTSNHVILTIGSGVFLIGLFLAPLLLRHRFPLATVLIYWILFTYLPTQILSFSHPVTDRYLYLPSVAAVILISWTLITVAKKIERYSIPLSVSLLLIIAFFWARNTISYLDEWQDPRSVWYYGQNKSTDAQIYWNLGCHYQDMADGLGIKKRKEPLSETESVRLAKAVWTDSARLEPLISEWERGQKSGPLENEFKNYLLTLAWNNFEKTKQTKGDRILPELYFRRGLVLLDKGDLAGAKKEFLVSVDEGSRHSFEEARQTALVRGHNALGILAWTVGNYDEALMWLAKAEQEQNQFGRVIVPDLSENRKKLEGIISSKSSH